jgi:gamma-glutamyl-gamma-aminobutyrate hydrolase PuuD
MKTYHIPTGNWPLRIDPYHELMNMLELSESDKDSADVLLLPGGSDIGMRPERDKAEFRAYEEFTFANKPILGICRGLQVMLHLTDENLIDHIPDKTSEYMHTTLSGDWKGESSWHITNLGLNTNSRHHQGFFMNEVNGWDILDYTADGIVEAVKFKNQFAVQWHPEHEEMKNTAAQEWWINTAKEIIYNKN